MKYTREMKLTIKDFEQMEYIDHEYFSENTIAPAKEAYKWYLADPNSCIVVKENNKVVAYINILSLKKEVYDKVKNNILNESEIVMGDLELNKEKYFNYLYFPAIAIDQNYRNIRVLKKLLDVAKEHIKEITKNATILEVMADCSTKEGTKITQRILKLKPYKKTSHNSTIHIAKGDDFVKNLLHTSNL